MQTINYTEKRYTNAIVHRRAMSSCTCTCTVRKMTGRVPEYV